jgi:hypothetical protein
MQQAGPGLWRKLHAFARNWKGDKRAALAHLAALDDALPCDACRKHWRALLRLNPVDLSSPAAFFRWTVDRHNDVSAAIAAGGILKPNAKGDSR